MMHLAMRVGRLLEVRAVLPIRLSEIPGVTAQIRQIFEEKRGLLVAILDARSYGVEPPKAADQFIETIKRDNPRIERSAFLIEPGQSLLGLQLDRLIREAGNPNRRLFRDVIGATAFLRPSLTDAEYARLEAFLESRDG